MMKKLFLPLITVLIFSGCQQKQEDQAAHDAKVAQQAREALLKEIKAKEKAKNQEMQQKQGRLANAGIVTTPDGKIIIDTNKTKSYFQQIAAQMKAKADKFAADMQKGIIEEKEAGIEVSEDHIVIDLNRTKGFLEKWANKVEDFAKEFDTITNEINNTAKGY